MPSTQPAQLEAQNICTGDIIAFAGSEGRVEGVVIVTSITEEWQFGPRRVTIFFEGGAVETVDADAVVDHLGYASHR